MEDLSMHERLVEEALPRLAGNLSKSLQLITGERSAILVLVQTREVSRYVCNLDLEQALSFAESLVERLRQSVAEKQAAGGVQ